MLGLLDFIDDSMISSSSNCAGNNCFGIAGYPGCLVLCQGSCSVPCSQQCWSQCDNNCYNGGDAFPCLGCTNKCQDNCEGACKGTCKGTSLK